MRATPACELLSSSPVPTSPRRVHAGSRGSHLMLFGARESQLWAGRGRGVDRSSQHRTCTGWGPMHLSSAGGAQGQS